MRNLSARILLLGLELLVAADIVRTVALEPSLESVAVLGLLVVIRTFLSWSLIVEIEGRWPWQVVPGRRETPTMAYEDPMTGLSTTAVLGLLLVASLATRAAGLDLANTTDMRRRQLCTRVARSVSPTSILRSVTNTLQSIIGPVQGESTTH